MPFLMNIAKKATEAKTAPAPTPVVLAPPPAPTPSLFLSLSGSAEPANQSISVIEIPMIAPPPTPVASEELCASPLALASTTSSHTEESSE